MLGASRQSISSSERPRLRPDDSSRREDRCSPRRCSPPMIPIPTISFTGCAIRPSSSRRCAGLSKTAPSPRPQASESSADFLSLQPRPLRSRRRATSSNRRATSERTSNRISCNICVPNAELRAIVGDDVLGETRFDPDGSLDILEMVAPAARRSGAARPRRAEILRLGRRAWTTADARASRKAAFAARSRLHPRALARRPPSTSGKRNSAITITRSSSRPKRWRRARAGWRRPGEAQRARACREAAQEIEAQLQDYWSAEPALPAAGSARTAPAATRISISPRCSP